MSASLFAAAIVRYFTGWWWLAAAMGKLRTWPRFRDNLDTSFGVPPALAHALAPALVAAELAAAAMVLGPAAGAGMAVSLALMLVFTGVLAYRFLTRAVIRCSCFGEDLRPLSGHDVVRNLLVLCAIAAALGLAPAGSLAAGESLLAAALGAFLCVAAVNFHDIVVLARTA